MADVSVRLAGVADAADIGRIQVETWRTAYAALLPTGALDGLTVAHAQEIWRDALATSAPRHRVLVALEQRWTVGFAAAAPADDLPADEPERLTTVAIAALLVEPRWGRRGHGSRLLAAATDLARGDGMTRAIAWIPDGDSASRAFFGSAGWAPDGLARGLDAGGGELREIRLHAALPGASG